MPYVYSTISQDNIYCKWAQGGGDMPIAREGILIRGGSGIPDRHLWTPDGVRTEVTDAQLAELHSDSLFQIHMKAGFLKVDDKKRDASKAASDMNQADESKPLTPDDYQDDSGPQPIRRGRKPRGD